MSARWIASSVLLLSALLGASAAADESLATASGCLECHRVAEPLIGPSFGDIAARYRVDATARAMLIGRVRSGGKGHWTEVSHGVPMPPFSPRLSDEEIEQLVDWVLGL